MKIFSLEAENVKHLKMVKIKPDGSLIIVGGDNAQGKTCVLDSIEMALHGAGSIPPKPIRDGQKKARIVLDLGDIVVTRTFTEKGSSLVVKNKDGATFASPQAILDKLVGALTFDPLEFSKMDTKRQSEVLKTLLGLTFDSDDAKYKKLFADRTEINRGGKNLKVQFDEIEEHEGLPDAEVSMKCLSDQYTAAIEHNRVLEAGKKNIGRFEERLLEIQTETDTLTKRIATEKTMVKKMSHIDADAIRTQMETSEITNKKIREKHHKIVLSKQLDALRKESASLTIKMKKLTDKKAASLSKAKFPIKGLSLDGDVVLFEDIPFEQCSAAQRIRVSVAMGLSMNPKLRVLLIREGSLLDDKNLEMVAKMADKADAQVWMERVSKGSECQVIIQDGSVLEKEKSSVE